MTLCVSLKSKGELLDVIEALEEVYHDIKDKDFDDSEIILKFNQDEMRIDSLIVSKQEFGRELN